MAKRKIACLGDPVGIAGGTIISSGQDGTFLVEGLEVAVEGAIARRSGDWTQTINPTVSKTFFQGKRIIVEGDECNNGAVVNPPDRGVYVE
jgi:uncharacterized Zn-binding protein involved in type VI secretion